MTDLEKLIVEKFDRLDEKIDRVDKRLISVETKVKMAIPVITVVFASVWEFVKVKILHYKS